MRPGNEYSSKKNLIFKRIRAKRSKKCGKKVLLNVGVGCFGVILLGQFHLIFEIQRRQRWSTGTWKDTQHHESEKYKLKWGITLRLSERLWPKSLQITNVDEDVEKRGSWYTPGGNINLCSSPVENSVEVPPKTSIWSTHSTPDYVFEENENPNSKRPMFIAEFIIAEI